MRAFLAAAGLVLSACAQPPPQSEPQAGTATEAAASVYAEDTAWLCRPGRQDVCSTARVDAVRVDARGERSPAPFQAAANPPIDCFYVYPTVSLDPTPISDMTAGPEEGRSAASQVGRFASSCRVFAPVYRQITLAGLRSAMSGAGPVDRSEPYGDVQAAWREYLRRDNKGRGVVLIGHSQGAILLSRLLAEEIEPDPAQHRLLVSAILSGHPGLAVPNGKDVGGDLKKTPLCRAPGQTGCAVVFASYAATDLTPRRFFGRVSGEGRSAACVNPAAPGGGAAPLRSFLRPPVGPTSGPPYLELVGQLQAECVSDAAGSVLRVTVLPGPNAAVLHTALASAMIVPGWGLHIMDMSLAGGSLLDMVDAQTRTWTAQAGARR
jgi:hypothetical protein